MFDAVYLYVPVSQLVCARFALITLPWTTYFASSVAQRQGCGCKAETMTGCPMSRERLGVSSNYAGCRCRAPRDNRKRVFTGRGWCVGLQLFFKQRIKNILERHWWFVSPASKLMPRTGLSPLFRYAPSPEMARLWALVTLLGPAVAGATIEGSAARRGIGGAAGGQASSRIDRCRWSRVLYNTPTV